jgi:hypothetical protein
VGERSGDIGVFSRYALSSPTTKFLKTDVTSFVHELVDELYELGFDDFSPTTDQGVVSLLRKKCHEFINLPI